MIIDTSVVLAILCEESGHQRYERAIAEARCRMSVVSFLEAAILIEGLGGGAAGYELDALLEAADIGLEPVTLDQAQAAHQAWRRFGKGQHPSGLNLGDCFAYALAKATGEPLLFKGPEFARTDIEIA